MPENGRFVLQGPICCISGHFKAVHLGRLWSEFQGHYKIFTIYAEQSEMPSTCEILEL